MGDIAETTAKAVVKNMSFVPSRVAFTTRFSTRRLLALRVVATSIADTTSILNQTPEKSGDHLDGGETDSFVVFGHLEQRVALFVSPAPNFGSS